MSQNNLTLDDRFDLLVRRAAAAGSEGVFSRADEQTPQLIELAEQRLGISFEPSLRRYLERHNGGHMAGFELLWLVEPDHGSWPDLVFMTEDARSDRLCSPWDVYVASDDDRYYFARHGPEQEDVGIYERWMGKNGHVERFASNYIEFLEKSLDQCLT